MATTGGRYFGFVIGGVLPAALAAKWLAVAWEKNAAMAVLSPVAARIEAIVLGDVKALSLLFKSRGDLAARVENAAKLSGALRTS